MKCQMKQEDLRFSEKENLREKATSFSVTSCLEAANHTGQVAMEVTCLVLFTR